MNLGFLKAIKIHDCHPCMISFSFAIRYTLLILRYYFVTFYLTIHTFLSFVIHLRLLKIDCRLSNSNIDSFYCSAQKDIHTYLSVFFRLFFASFSFFFLSRFFLFVFTLFGFTMCNTSKDDDDDDDNDDHSCVIQIRTINLLYI